MLKNRTVYTCPIPSKGLSTVFAPIHVRIIMIDNKAHSFVFFIGENFLLLLFFGIITARIRIDIARATTPPSLEGIDRRTTYAKRKYHSG